MLKVFEGWASEQVKTAGEIAEATGAEELLIGMPFIDFLQYRNYPSSTRYNATQAKMKFLYGS